MALWSNTDEFASVPKYLKNKVQSALQLARQSLPAGTRIIFVDIEEAATQAGQDTGMNSPGWWAYYEYSAGGVTRHKCELLVALPVTAAVAGDVGISGYSGMSGVLVTDVLSDDTILDTPVISWTTQPVSDTVIDTDTDVTLGPVLAVADPTATVSYQWQEWLAGEWEDFAGQNTDTLTLATVSVGERLFRVKATATGAVDSFSDTATLTIEAA